MIENTLKIIIPSLFKAKIQYIILIMKFKLMQKFVSKFRDKLKRAIKLRNFKVDRERVNRLFANVIFADKLTIRSCAPF